MSIEPEAWELAAAIEADTGIDAAEVLEAIAEAGGVAAYLAEGAALASEADAASRAASAAKAEHEAARLKVIGEVYQLEPDPGVMLVIETTNTRGRQLTTGGRFGSPAYENIVTPTLCPREARNPRLMMVLDHIAMLENPGSGCSYAGLAVTEDSISFAGQTFRVTEADRLRLAAEIARVLAY